MTQLAADGRMSTQVYRVRAGKKTDQLLHSHARRILAPYIPGSTMVDLGIGDGRFPLQYAELGPSELWLTDFYRQAAEAGVERLKAQPWFNPQMRVVGRQVDVTGDLAAAFDGKKFNVMNCISVLMHVPSELSARAIRNLAEHVAPGGVFLMGIICAELARELYIPAKSRGADYFYPLLAGLPDDATEADIPPEARVLAECYPVNGHYDHVCMALPKFNCRVHHAVIGDDFAGTPYGRFIGRPLWKLYEMTLPA